MNVKPVRIQRRRAKGYDMQAVSRAVNGLHCISVTRPGRWGNPYDVKIFGRELSLTLFRNSMKGVWSPDPVKNASDEICDVAYPAHSAFMRRFTRDHPLSAARSELRGHNLGCYCPIECVECQGTGNFYRRDEDGDFLPCDTCDSTGITPCHADTLLEIANGDSNA